MVTGNGTTLLFSGLVLDNVSDIVALARLMTTSLFGVTANDVTTVTTVSILLLSVASMACYLPARRATKVDPLIALQYE
jgi:putative ABC transport system permease protein